MRRFGSCKLENNGCTIASPGSGVEDIFWTVNAFLCEFVFVTSSFLLFACGTHLSLDVIFLKMF